MCDRLVIPDREEVEKEIVVSNRWWTFSTRFNVAVTDRVPAARVHARQSEGVMLRWGFIPGASEKTAAPPGEPRVASEQLDSDAQYRPAWLSGQRCIVPVAGFYVWQRAAAGHRQPFYVRMVNRCVFALAAVWDRFVTETDDVIESCAVVMVPANELLAEIDNTGGQMPAILSRDAYEGWLQGTPAVARSLLRTCLAERLVTHAVGPHVNFAQYDDPRLIRPIG